MEKLPLKILVMGETQSTNVGDQVIARCTEWIIQCAAKNTEILCFDWGRCKFGCSIENTDIPVEFRKRTSSSFLRVQLKSRLSSLAPWLLMFGRALKRMPEYFRYKRAYRNAMRGVDAVFIGGGQLLMDNAAVFPVRAAAAVQSAKSLGIPVVFYCVGVGENWGRLTRRLVHSALLASNVKAVLVRDSVSATRLNNIFPGITASVQLLFDPGLVSESAYGFRFAEKRANTIGIGIIGTQAVARRLPKHPLASAASEAYWTRLCELLINNGHTVRIFCNGADDDWRTASTVFANLARDENFSAHVELCDKPLTGGNLVELIAQFQVVIAARLHACVVATSLQVPCIGLMWDDKVAAFFSDLKLGSRCLGDFSTPERCVQLLGSLDFDERSAVLATQKEWVTQATIGGRIGLNCAGLLGRTELRHE